MCGLIGAFGDFERGRLALALERMRPRGPDAEGAWSEPGVWLGHRRLAILDLDRRADQPMHSVCGRYVIAFNGEIYNYRKLRQDLESGGASFRTTSDTEVLLELFKAHGEGMLSSLRGMFAFLIWDRQERRAFMARDPYGIKPLYLATAAEGLLVGSQVRALMATGCVSREPSVHGQAAYWMLGSVREPHTWYRDVQALGAGQCAWLQPGQPPRPWTWCDIGDAWRSAPVGARTDPRPMLREQLADSVAAHMTSDVPVGVFLSGGLDSAILAASMSAVARDALQGVTLHYREYDGLPQDERPAAAAIASDLGIRHTARLLEPAEFLADMPRIIASMDQPSIDGVNTWYASKAASEQGLKVVVSGVGGDELLQGYASFRILPRVLAGRRAAGGVPGLLPLIRRFGEAKAESSGKSRWRWLVDWTQTVPGAWWLSRSVRAPDELESIMGRDAAEIALLGFSPDAWVAEMAGRLPADDRLALSQIESSTYLRNQLLRDSDWASMAHSVELRTPLVDAGLLFGLRSQLSSFSGYTKRQLLESALPRRLPEPVLRRPKSGFGIPVTEWWAQSQGLPRSVADSRWWAMEVARLYGDVLTSSGGAESG
jgi:asparagine synthase (glutamine-hydrolysing)